MNLNNLASDDELLDVFSQLDLLAQNASDSYRKRASSLAAGVATKQGYESILDSEEDSLALGGMIRLLITQIRSRHPKIMFNLPVAVLLAYLLGKRRGFQNNLPVFVVREMEQDPNEEARDESCND